MVEVRGHSVDRLDARSSASDASGSDGQRQRGRRARSAQRYGETKPKRRHRYFGSAGSSLTSIPGKIQLSMLNSGLIPIAEEDKAIRAIPKKPVEKANFIKYCEQHRKYPILFKVEFQVHRTELVFARKRPLDTVPSPPRGFRRHLSWQRRGRPMPAAAVRDVSPAVARLAAPLTDGHHVRR
ncbi:hypothetical protein FJT64_019877 [Amphibalanus amphitrite]|uniref:Uncharacterized protein n=1 Tax=Amphibalanus amphitrite TaxID=1232801 RepID=A0A6A4WZ01_AMPAM|nr:hypothetical protein FJT64_019877 [Amphibalanus amphitrite]